MTLQRFARLTAVATFVAAQGCALSTRLTAPPRDYQDYRRTRLATTLEARLSECRRYLARRPEGRFRAEVKTWFLKNEPLYFERSLGSVEQLERYLSVLPNGPHVQAAEERLTELRAVRKFEERHEQELNEHVSELHEKLDEAQRMRRDLVRQFVEWSARISKIRTFFQPTSALDDQLIYEWRMLEPYGRCQGDRCTKTLSLPYAVPEERRLGARRAIFDVAFVLEHGGVIRAVVTGPELFNRVTEAAEVRSLRSGQPAERALAISRAAGLVAGAVEESLPSERCERPAVAPVALIRECDGVRLRMIAATGENEEDRIEIEPVQASPAQATPPSPPTPPSGSGFSR